MAAAIHSVDDPVELVRTFQKGETHAYEVKSFMLLETKAYPLAYFHPSTVDINYDFTMAVKDLTPAGFASVLYERPIMYIIDGETAESAPVTHEEKVEWKMDLKLSR